MSFCLVEGTAGSLSIFSRLERPSLEMREESQVSSAVEAGELALILR